MNPELITKWRQQKEELKDFNFTKSLMESNAYDFTVTAHNFEEALEIAKGNCPVYSDKCMWGGYWDMRYAEGGGHEVLSWGKHSKEESLQLKPTDELKIQKKVYEYHEEVMQELFFEHQTPAFHKALQTAKRNLRELYAKLDNWKPE